MDDRSGVPARAGTPDLAILVVGAARAVADRLTEELRASGFRVRPAHGYVLRALHGRPLTLTGLAALLGITKQSVAVVIDEMEAAGLVSRAPDPSDRRAKRLQLTATGEAARMRALDVSAEIEAELEAQAGPRAVAAARAALLALIECHDGGDDVAAGRARPVW